MTDENKTTFADLFYVLRESQIKMAYSLNTLCKFFVFCASTQLILICWLFWKFADRTSDLVLLLAMFVATALPLSWGLLVLPQRLHAMLIGKLRAPAEAEPPQG